MSDEAKPTEVYDKEFVAKKVDRAMEILFEEVHQVAKTKSGDIEPLQLYKLKEIEEELTELIFQQVNQNL